MSGQRTSSITLVAGVCAVVVFTNLGGPRLWDRDEPRNAGCAREMLDRGDWIVPVFNGELRTHKPVLLYWCMMAAYQALGVSELAARLPSALSAIGTVVCTILIGRRLFGAASGLWAGIVLSSSLMFVMLGRAATPDSLLIFFTTLALTIYVCGTFPPARQSTMAEPVPPHGWFPARRSTAFAMYAAMSLAALAKGPVGVLLPCTVIGLFLLAMCRPDAAQQSSLSDGFAQAVLRQVSPRRFLATFWLMRPFTLLLAVMLVAVPWYWAVGSATGGAFLREFLLEHNFGRAAGVMEGHSGNVLFYPAALLVGFFPWSVFAIPLIVDQSGVMRRRGSVHPGQVLALCWIGVYVVLFSLARTKLPNYIAPCLPAVALLTGDYVRRWSRQLTGQRWLYASFGCYALVGAIVAVAVPLAARRYLPGEEWLGFIGLLPLLAGLVCLRFLETQRPRRAATVFAGSAVAFCALVFGVATQRADAHRTMDALLQEIRAQSSDPQVASYGVLEPSWVFYGGRPITELPRPKPVPGTEQVVRFLEIESESFVITPQEQMRELEPALPHGVVVLAETDRFLSTQKLVLLGRSRDSRADDASRRVTTAAASQRY